MIYDNMTFKSNHNLFKVSQYIHNLVPIYKLIFFINLIFILFSQFQ
jgi:hypothetical protein